MRLLLHNPISPSLEHLSVWLKFRRGIMKEVQTKPEGDQKIINESKENAVTFLRIHLCIKGFSIIDWVYHFTSKKKLKEKQIKFLEQMNYYKRWNPEKESNEFFKVWSEETFLEGKNLEMVDCREN